MGTCLVNLGPVGSCGGHLRSCWSKWGELGEGGVMMAQVRSVGVRWVQVGSGWVELG